MPIRLVRPTLRSASARSSAERLASASAAGRRQRLGARIARRHGASSSVVERAVGRAPRACACVVGVGADVAAGRTRRLDQARRGVGVVIGRLGRLGPRWMIGLPRCHRYLRDSPPDAVAVFPVGERATCPLLSSVASPGGPGPERFRGGCSFGAATLAALQALPHGDIAFLTVPRRCHRLREP